MGRQEARLGRWKAPNAVPGTEHGSDVVKLDLAAGV